MGTKRFRNYSIEQRLEEWVTPLVEHRVLGFTSKSQVMHYALRRLVDQYLEWGIHPWSTRKQQDPRNPKAASIAVLAVVAVAVLVGLFQASPGIDGAVWLDVPRIYLEYSPFIDFFLYLAFFIGIVQVGLGKVLQNRAVTISVATMLAIGAAAMEPVFGFSLRAFGPVAIGVFLLVAGTLIYRTLRAFEVHRIGAGAVIVILLYLGLATFLPEANASLSRAVPVLPLLVVLVVAFLVAKFSESRFPSTARSIPHDVATDVAPGLAEEERLVREFLSRQSKDSNNAGALLSSLTELLNLIDRVGTVPEARNLLAQRLERILPKVLPIEQAMEELDELVEKAQRVDLKLFVDLKSVYPKLTPKEQREVRGEIREAMTKLGVERKLQQLSRRTKERATDLRGLLNKCEQFLRAADVERARRMIEDAIAEEQEIQSLLVEIQEIETAIHELTKRELKSLPSE